MSQHQKFANPPMVVKVGGALLDERETALQLFRHIAAMRQCQPVVLVHGGGNHVQSLFEHLGLPTQKHQGLRITPEEHLPYVVGALAGTANKSLVALARQAGLNAVGISLADGNIATCDVLDTQLGCVGKVTGTNHEFLTMLTKQGVFPIVSSIGCDQNGNLLNVNADDAAVAVASALHAPLYLLSDVKGVLDQHGDLLNELTNTQISTLITDGVITDGMAVKVSAALAAATQINQPVTIGSWRDHAVLTQHNSAPSTVSSGTTIYPPSLS